MGAPNAGGVGLSRRIIVCSRGPSVTATAGLLVPIRVFTIEEFKNPGSHWDYRIYFVLKVTYLRTISLARTTVKKSEKDTCRPYIYLSLMRAIVNTVIFHQRTVIIIIIIYDAF